MTTQIFEDYSSFLNREDKTLNGVTQEFADENEGWDEERNNDGCWNCRSCSDCSDCSEKIESKDALKIPIVENIHQKILEAVTKPGNVLNMADVHTCETTHCRAGWAVVLAGQEGFDLEAKTDWAFAAMQIYKASSPIKSITNKILRKQ